MTERKAICTPFAQAVPNVPVIDTEHCVYFSKGTCRACERFCDPKAIDFEQQDKEVEVGAVIVATVNNAAAINMSVKKAAMALIKPGIEITEGLLNRVEMAWRPYDPCFACATHNLPGSSPLPIEIYDSKGKLIKRFPEG